MIQVRRGRGGWRNKKVNSAALIFAFLAFALVPSGCSSKKNAAQAGAASSGAPSTLGEQGLTGPSSSSLAQFQRGTLGRSRDTSPLADIHFDFDDYTVRPQDSEILRRNAQWLEAHGNPRVQIEGHCDERGSEEYNIALGAKRAQAAKDYLVTLGVPADRLSTISYGKELPLCTEHTEECYALNRRAHFVVLQ